MKASVKELEDKFEISKKAEQKEKKMEHRKDKKMRRPIQNVQHLNRSSVKGVENSEEGIILKLI